MDLHQTKGGRSIRQIRGLDIQCRNLKPLGFGSNQRGGPMVMLRNSKNPLLQVGIRHIDKQQTTDIQMNRLLLRTGNLGIGLPAALGRAEKRTVPG